MWRPYSFLLLVLLPAAAVAQRPAPRPEPTPEARPAPRLRPAPEAWPMVDIGPIHVSPVDVGPIYVPPIELPFVHVPAIEIPPIHVPAVDIEAIQFAFADIDARQFEIEDDLSWGTKAHRGREPFATRPREGWAAQDQADSLYRAGREALNRYEYRRAAQIFRQLRDRYPRSEYAGDAAYWEAFSLYRVGTIDDLRSGLRVLESQNNRYSRQEIQADAAALAARIRGALAVRGDQNAADVVRRAAQANGQPCDQEDIAVRVEALSALSQMDGETVVPILRRVLARKDECSAQLRRRALSILGRRGDTAAVATFLSVAKNDPDANVRGEAINYLSRQPGERVVDALEDLLRTSNDERVQRFAVRALSHHESPRARRSLRALIERTDVPEQLRREAIGSFERERSSAEDAAYVRSVYGRLESEKLKESVINAVGRLGGADNEQWLANLVKNPNESMQLRAAALNRLGRTTLPIAEFSKMYDAATERGIREQVMNVLAYRKDPEATDKLIDIARTGTDPQLRRLAINYLTRKNDPRTQKLLLEILDK
jgi:HEAT repeat protein